MVSSEPGSISPVSGVVVLLLGVVGAVVGFVVGAVLGRVAGAVLGRVEGCWLGALVPAGASLPRLRQPAKVQMVRTATRVIQMIFFILKPPEITDFTTSISKGMSFTLGKFDQNSEKREKF